MESIAKYLNYRLDIQPPPNREMWGEYKNGSFSGLVGELQKENSDIGWADLYIVPDRMKYIDYTDPYDIEYACFMLAKPPPIPQVSHNNHNLPNT